MLELPHEFIQWAKIGLTVFLFACLYLAVVATLLLAAGFELVRWFVRFRRPQHVLCPTTGEDIQLTIAAAPAALAALFGERDIRIRSCSRGLPFNACDRGCAAQVLSPPPKLIPGLPIPSSR